jgi:hypothetical protein
MRVYPVLIAGLLVISCSVSARGADKGASARLQEEFIAQLQFPANSVNLDRQLRKELAKVLPKLKATGKGKLIKVEGDFARAGNEEEFLQFSAMMASSVKRYLDESGRLSNETFVATRKYLSSEIARKANMVRIYLIPRMFRVEMIDFDRLPVNQKIYRESLETAIPAPVETQVGNSSSTPPPIVKEQSAEEAAAQKRMDTERQAVELQVREAAQQADEAVAKVRARAMERARRQAEQETKSVP